MIGWIDFKKESPQFTGPYRVKNQYQQQAQSFWNGKF